MTVGPRRAHGGEAEIAAGFTAMNSCGLRTHAARSMSRIGFRTILLQAKAAAPLSVSGSRCSKLEAARGHHHMGCGASSAAKAAEPPPEQPVVPAETEITAAAAPPSPPKAAAAAPPVEPPSPGIASPAKASSAATPPAPSPQSTVAAVAATAPPPPMEDDGHVPLPDEPPQSSSYETIAGDDEPPPPAEPPAEAMTPSAPVVLVLGGPGSGKDTICEMLVEKYGCVHLSAVDVLRQAVTSATPRGTMISDMIRSGQIVPAQVTLDLLKDEMRSRDGPYVVQGFPKTHENLEDLEAQCGRHAPSPAAPPRILVYVCVCCSVVIVLANARCLSTAKFTTLVCLY